MRAVELRIVFEDDEGQAYVHTYKAPSAAILSAVAAIEAARAIGHAAPVGIGPVLRKTTEVEGRLVAREFHDDEARISFPREPSGIMRCRGIDEHLFPDGVAAKYDETKDDYAGPLYRFRFDVTAFRMPEVKP